MPGELGRQPHRPGGAPVALHRGPRPVGGQLQERRQAGELPSPPVDLTLQDLAAQPGALPDREIRVLHRQLRQRRGLPLSECGIERGHLAHQDPHGPAVARDVVQGERDGMVLRRQAQQHAAQHRTTGEIERPAGLFPGQGESRRLARGLRQPRQVHQRQGEGGRRLDHLHRRVLLQDEDGAQGLVAAHDLLQAAPQHRGSQRPFGAQRQRHVVERAFRLELIDEPEPLLGERQGQVPLARRRQERGPGQLRPGAARGLDPRGEGLHRGGLEQIAHRQLDAEGGTQARDHPRRQQRVPAEREEMVVQPHPLEAEQLGPDAGHPLLDRRTRRQPGLWSALPFRRRQGLPVHLAVGGERQGFEGHEGGRHHVVRQPLAQLFAQRRGAARPIAASLTT